MYRVVIVLHTISCYSQCFYVAIAHLDHFCNNIINIVSPHETSIGLSFTTNP